MNENLLIKYGRVKESFEIQKYLINEALSKMDILFSDFEFLIKNEINAEIENGDFIPAQYKDGFVYVFLDKKNSICKIGYSTNPQRRLMNIKTSYPHELIILTSFKGTFTDEKILHMKFSKYRINNSEWFDFNDEIDNYFKTLI